MNGLGRAFHQLAWLLASGPKSGLLSSGSLLSRYRSSGGSGMGVVFISDMINALSDIDGLTEAWKPGRQVGIND